MNASLSTELQQLHDRVISIGKEHRRLGCRIVEILIEVDQAKLYKLMNCSSLFVYAVKFLGLDEAEAYASISVARKAVEMPPLRKAIQELGLSVSKASRIVSTLTVTNAEGLVDFARKHSMNEINREMSRLGKKEGLPEKCRTVKLSADTLSKAKEARKLMSKEIDLDMAINRALEEYIERHHPVRKAQRAIERKKKNLKQGNGLSKERKVQKAPDELCLNRVNTIYRVPLTAEERHAVFARDGNQCTKCDENGERCPNDRFLQIHHIIPVSKGGTNHPDNLTTLCSFHHDLVHQLSFPIEGQVNWLREPVAVYGINQKS